MKSLTDKESPYARKYSAIPASRTAVYAAHSHVKEDERMSFWSLGTIVFDDPKQLIKWSSAIPAWNVDIKSDEDIVNTALENEKLQIDSFRNEVENLEAQKLALSEDYDANKRRLQLISAEKCNLLKTSVNSRISVLLSAQEKLDSILNTYSIYFPEATGDNVKGFIGPHSGRDSAIALAWLETSSHHLSDEPTTEFVNQLWKYYHDVSNELGFLRQMDLAAKVVSHVTSPTHKKMLNLCYNWLSTFLPHCLAKINRVSFGLLSSDDCKAALKQDPHVPRSRLKLAVPFVGKDVPSKASEFAHPDIVIGMTVLAYRYSGLRNDDFFDIIDSMTTEFGKEIGPARERKSSLRHEEWVYASGGRVRGLKTTKDGLSWNLPESLSEEEQSKKEVVQLKFLQKSNVEQMDKLFNLVKLEPLG